MLDALLNIVAIIAIIAVGAFVIVLLSDLLISIIDGKNGIFFKRGNKNKEDLPERPKMVKYEIEEEKPEELVSEPVPQLTSSEPVKPQVEEPKEKEEFDFSTFVQEQPKQEKVESVSRKTNEDYVNEITEISKAILDDEEVALDDEEDEVEEESQDNNEDIEAMKKELEEQRKLIEQLVANQNKPEEVEEETEEVSEQVEEAVEEEPEVKEEAKEEVEEQTQATNEELEQMRKELEEQRKAYEELLNQKNQAEEQNKALLDEKENLEKALEEQNQTEEIVKPAETMDELTARLAILEERLKSNEKLLKANKKEFMPLYRINKSLDNDTKKLRRKEASVAKRKVLLYGVNNYVDIDEDKAKELSEELDLLEGLRLSVKDAKTVMEANKDRYPILEETNRILNQTVADIKSDIEDVKAKIEILNSENAGEDNEGTNNTDAE